MYKSKNAPFNSKITTIIPQKRKTKRKAFLSQDDKASALTYYFIKSLILAQDERWRRA